MISISEDKSDWDVQNPLDKDLNLTEYEMKVRAENGIEDSNIEALSDNGGERIYYNKFRMASGDATDGASELSRRKSELTAGKLEPIVAHSVQ